MVRFGHLIPASLTLSIGLAPGAATTSSPSSPEVLAGQGGNALADDIARLHQSVKQARSIIEIRDADVAVPESKLQDILGDIKSLEEQVSDLLPDEAGAGTDADATKSAQSSDGDGCEGSTDQVGPAGPSRGKANCSLNAGAAARKPAQKSTLQISRPVSSPEAGLSSSGHEVGRLPGAVFDEADASKISTTSSAPSLAVSELDPEPSESNRDGGGSQKGAANHDVSTPGPSSNDGKGKVSHGASSNKVEGESGPAPASKTIKEDNSAPPMLGKTPLGASTPRFLTARPAKPAQQAVVSQKPAATDLASPKDGSRNAGPMTMSLREELTTTTITRTGSSRTTIRITKTRTRTIWLDGRTKAPRMSGMTKSAAPSPIADYMTDQDADRSPGRFAMRTSDKAKSATSNPSTNGGGQEDVKVATQMSAKTKPATSSPTTNGRDRNSAGASSRTSAKTKAAGSSSVVGGARNQATERTATATRAPNFTKASPSVNAQLVGLQRYTNSTSKLSVPLRAERVPLDDKTVATRTTTSLAHAKAAAPATTTRKRLSLPPSAGQARTSSPPPSGFKTIPTRASKRANETKK